MSESTIDRTRKLEVEELRFRRKPVLNGAAFDQVTKVAAVPLRAVDSAGGVFAWANPETGAIIVDRVEVDVKTQSTGACTLSVGTAANGTTLSANLIDTQSVAAVALLDNITDKGTNGKSRQKAAAGAYVTGSVASGASAGLVGFAYIHYRAAL